MIVTLEPWVSEGVAVPLPPLAMDSTEDNPAAVPVVFWLNVGQVNVPELKLPEAGVPSAGVTSVGEFDNTTLPVPVDVVTPVPPLATAKVPATVTAPEVAVAGVKPVEPKLIVDTPSTTLEATLT